MSGMALTPWPGVMTMPKIFVFRDDDYPGDGGVGLEMFDTTSEAVAYITGRLAQDDERSILNYTVIKGVELRLKVVEVATKVKLDG